MRKIEKTIYNFDELNKEIQEKLIENEKETDRDFYINYYLHDDMGSKASDLINNYFGVESDYLKTYYDLDYSQGSGAMIEFDIDIKDLNNKYKVFTDDEIEYLKQKDVINTLRVRHNNSHYYHEYCFEIKHDYYNDWDFEDIKDDFNITEDDFNTLWTRFENLVDCSNKHYTTSPFITDIINMNKELVRYGYDVIENYDYDMGFIMDRLNENEYYENGEVYYGD